MAVRLVLCIIIIIILLLLLLSCDVVTMEKVIVSGENDAPHPLAVPATIAPSHASIRPSPFALRCLHFALLTSLPPAQIR